MARTGPKPQRTDGYHVTAKGYLRRNRPNGRGMVFQHVEVWEARWGPVPAGFVLHHINGDKQDNRLENLQAVTPTHHKRLHSGCELRDGEWWKPCGICRELKPITTDHWYLSPEGWPLYGRCRPCHIHKVVESKRLRRLRDKTDAG